MFGCMKGCDLVYRWIRALFSSFWFMSAYVSLAIF